MFKPRLIAGALALAGSLGTAWSAEYSVSGYATLGASKLSTNQASYRATSMQGPGASDDWNTGVDTRAGLQLTAKADARLSGTVHLLSEKGYRNSYTPSVEWAYLKYEAMPALTLRAGRLGLPGFMLSDYLRVGYSMTAVHGPVEVYSQLPISNFDGADALWRTSLGGVGLTVQPFVGHSEIRARFSDASGSKARGNTNLYGANVVGEIGDWTLRIGRIEADVNMESDQTNTLLENLRTFGATATANKLDYRGKHSSFTGLGVTYDNGKALLQSEYTIRKAGGFLADSHGWYVLGGYRIGNLTPYAIAARQRTSYDPVPASGIPMLDGFVNGLLMAGNTSQKSWSAGVRWDFAKNLALKAQYDRITPNNGSNAGLLMYGGSTPLGSQNVVSVTLDTVF